MKPSYFTFLLCLPIFSSNAQIPNGNFEEWETINNIEFPVFWQTNNYYESSTPVDKEEEDAIEGNYSMKISSTALGIGNQLPGCAHIKFLPQQFYKYFIAAVKIDSIEMGEIAIRVKQRTSNGLFEKIGEWGTTTVTAGVSQIVFPITQTQLDTILVEIWAFNTWTPNGVIGYSEAIIDKLNLVTASSLNGGFANSVKWLIFPNPTKDFVSIHLDQALLGSSQVRLLDLQGRVHKTHQFSNLKETTMGLEDIPPGVYLLELRKAGELIKQTKLVVLKK